MALGGVFMTDTDGNIGSQISNLSEKVCGLLFDVSAQSDIWTQGVGASLKDTLKDTVVELNSLEDAVKLGIAPYTGEVDSDGVSRGFLHGIPYYHIKHFFNLNSNSGRLFVAFADCSNNWNALIDMQKAAMGAISQFGVWTEQSLWTHMDPSAQKYSIALVGDLQAVAAEMANSYNAPACILLNANSAKVSTSSGTTEQVVLSQIPTCVVDARYVSVLLGQALDVQVTNMQIALDSKTPVGAIGAALGCLAKANVGESIGWVKQFNIVTCFPDIEFGFGDATVENGKLKNSTKYSSLTARQLDELDENGYIFLVRYAGLEGVYFSKDQTCSNKDYRTIARNRTINKSRRLVRSQLLPYVNSPIKIDPSSGQLSTAQITDFKNLISSALNVMSQEVSGIGSINIPANQNILQTDALEVQYKITPLGCAEAINVYEGLTIKQ